MTKCNRCGKATRRKEWFAFCTSCEKKVRAESAKDLGMTRKQAEEIVRKMSASSKRLYAIDGGKKGRGRK